MARPPSADRDAPAVVNTAAIVVVSSETGAAYDELTDRLSYAYAACCMPLDSRTNAAISQLISDGATHIAVVPLSAGTGAPEEPDIAGLLSRAKSRWPHVTFLQTNRFAAREHIVGWASRRAQEALHASPGPVSARSTAVIVVGEGGSPDANAEVAAMSRLLWEHHDFDLVEPAFAQTHRSSTVEAIDRCQRLGAERIIVIPLRILDGPCCNEIRMQTLTARNNGTVSPVAIAPALLTPIAAASVVTRRCRDALTRWARSGDDGCATAHSHPLSSGEAASEASDDVLPPRYRGNRAVSAASMRSAPLQYDAAGQVAWDRMWQSFCDLALAGGPPHRGTLLEAPSREEVLADRAASVRVAAEICRGLSLTTRLPVVPDAAPGWVGLVCRDEEMAIWLLRALVVENVSVRREGATLFLPAGPAYRVEKEIKNVITAVAKTHHYWAEHRAAR